MCIEAYTAGLLEGDGCISITRARPYQDKERVRYSLVVVFAMTDIEPLEKLSSYFEGKVRKAKLTSKGRQVWQWSVQGKQAKEFLEMVLPWLTSKSLQALIALRFPVAFRGEHAGNYMPIETYEKQEECYLELKATRDVY